RSILVASLRRVARAVLPQGVVNALNRARGRGVPTTPFSALALQNTITRRGEQPGSIKLRDNDAERARTLAGETDVAHFVDHIEYERPPEDLVFVMVCNDKYAPGLEGVLLSLRRV